MSFKVGDLVRRLFPENNEPGMIAGNVYRIVNLNGRGIYLQVETYDGVEVCGSWDQSMFEWVDAEDAR